MDYFVSNIVWDQSSPFQPTEMFICWENDCMTREEAIDFVADYYAGIIISCDVTKE